LAEAERADEARGEGDDGGGGEGERARAEAALEAEAVLGYCSAVRSAITDDGMPPLDSSGLDLHQRLTAVSASLAKVEEKRGDPPNPKGTSKGGKGREAAGSRRS
jgi:hypothetical protein